MRDRLGEALAKTECFLFDFDGPVCDLFSRHDSTGIAQELRELLEKQGEGASITEELKSTTDPHAILRTVHTLRGDAELTALLDRTITKEECTAAHTADGTPYADMLIEFLANSGRQIALTTNNSAAAADIYLDRVGLSGYFAGHIYARAADPGLLKPHPDCLQRALQSIGVPAENSAMVGDAESDFSAAKQTDVEFVGYARNRKKDAQLRAAGATHIVGSLAEVLRIVDPTARV